MPPAGAVEGAEESRVEGSKGCRRVVEAQGAAASRRLQLEVRDGFAKAVDAVAKHIRTSVGTSSGEIQN